MGGDEPPHRSEQLLRQLYIEENMSVSAISREIGSSEGVIWTHIYKYNLEKEPQEQLTLEDLECEIPEDTPWRNEELMRTLYVDHELSTTDISELLDCSTGTLSNWFKEHNIDTRGRHNRPSKLELRKMYVDKHWLGIEIGRRLGVNKTTIYNWLRDADIEIRDSSDYIHPDLKNEQKLERMYVEKEMTMAAIADELGALPGTVRDYMTKYGIELRDQREEITGKKNPFWKGGSKPYGKGWTNEKRKSVLDRDNYSCQACGMPQEDHKKETGQGLHIHHIIPASKFENPTKRNAMSNSVSMCSSCHKKWEGIPLNPTLL